MGYTKPKYEVKPEEKKPKPRIEKPKIETIAIVRLSGTDLDGDKNLVNALRGIKGISYVMSKAVVKVSGFDPKTKLGDLSESDREKLEQIIKDPAKFGVPGFLFNRRKDLATGKDIHLTGTDLIVAKKFDVEKSIGIKSYRGWRHMLGQPVRGQRTRSSFRGGRVVGVMRKEIKLQLKKEEEEKK